MGVNLIPDVRVDDMLVLEREFIKHNAPRTSPIQVNDGSLEDGCAIDGIHKIVKFNTLVKNIGDRDLILGNRENNEIYENSPVHKRIFRFPFFKYVLKDASGKEHINLKRPWCLTDNENCDNQQIRVGKADLYSKDHQCQFIIIDGYTEGLCEFSATINFFTIERIRKGENGFIIEEDDYTDNTIKIPINITNDRISPAP